jgi:hypothetical protein
MLGRDTGRVAIFDVGLTQPVLQARFADSKVGRDLLDRHARLATPSNSDLVVSKLFRIGTCRGEHPSSSTPRRYKSVVTNPFSRPEDAIVEQYKTVAFSHEFAHAIRSVMEATLADQAGAQKILRKQIEDQLARPATQEENLIDLAADGDLDSSRVRARLRDIARRRTELEAQTNAVQVT